METNDNVTTEIPEKIAESATAYLERLSDGHEKFSEALQTIRDRNARVADKFFDAWLSSQRDAIELSKSFAAEPAAYGKNMDAVLQAMTSAQERALDVAKTVYREQADTAGEIRTAAEKSFEATKTFSKPFEKMTSLWAPAAR